MAFDGGSYQDIYAENNKVHMSACACLVAILQMTRAEMVKDCFDGDQKSVITTLVVEL